MEEGRARVELSSPIVGGRSAGGRPQAREFIKRPRVLFVVALSTLLLVSVALILTIFLPREVEGPPAFSCGSEFKVSSVAAAERKGLAVDDATFLGCPGKIPASWPNADEKVVSIRLFKAWDSSWAADKRQSAWEAVVNFAKRNGAKVLVGTQITCSEAEDDADWANVLQLLKLLGPEHVMGVAIGNELELLQFKDRALVPESCVKNVWQGGYFLRKFDEHVRDLDSLGGFGSVPVTSAFGGAIMAAEPFWNIPNAMVLDFLRKVVGKYGSRWVYSLNVYPYFDPSNQMDPDSAGACTQALNKTHCWKDPSQCLFPGMVKTMRDRMKSVSAGNDRLWITETGWSSPMAGTLMDKPVHACKEFSSEDSFREYYQGFLAWDMQIEGSRGPDHVFYFTVRDSSNFGEGEYFGLIRDCSAKSCKLWRDVAPRPGQAPTPAPPPSPPRTSLAWA